MHLADLASYTQAQERVGELYNDPDAWAHKAIINVAHSGKFSSDRTIEEYAADIWKASPCPVEPRPGGPIATQAAEKPVDAVKV
jgi:starch phosphorylase